MGLEKYGIVVSCEHCNCVATDDSGSFEITVPVCLNPEGTEGIAKLRCAVSPAAHRVELLAWNDAANQPIELSAAVSSVFQPRSAMLPSIGSAAIAISVQRKSSVLSRSTDSALLIPGRA
jgi:hypothetical protein